MSRRELAEIYEHCERCEVCGAQLRLREGTFHSFEAASMRIAAGVFAALLLGLVIRMDPSHRIELYDVFSFAPPLVMQESNEQPAAVESEVRERGEVRTDSSREDLFEAAMVIPIGPKRFFVPPPRNKRVLEPVTLPAPPVIASVKIEVPRIPGTTPSLQPPRRNPFRRFVSALAVPFRRT
jgi:hypothetical protein